VRIETSFPGGLRVDAAVRGFRVSTDQPATVGGTDTAPSPFDLFLASMATCAGYYAQQFCRQRELPTEGLALALEPHRDPETGRLEEIRVEVELPEDFPEKYRAAIVRAVDRCAVKRVLLDPPRLTTVVREEALLAS